MISIHVPREGHDAIPALDKPRQLHFNPRAPRGARHVGVYIGGGYVVISIHVPREGHDTGGGSGHGFKS